jgi:hypothetical protein
MSFELLNRPEMFAAKGASGLDDFVSARKGREIVFLDFSLKFAK